MANQPVLEYVALVQVARSGFQTLQPIQAAQPRNGQDGAEAKANAPRRNPPTGMNVKEDMDMRRFEVHPTKANLKARALDQKINWLQRRQGLPRGKEGQWDGECQQGLLDFLKKPGTRREPRQTDPQPPQAPQLVLALPAPSKEHEQPQEQETVAQHVPIIASAESESNSDSSCTSSNSTDGNTQEADEEDVVVEEDENASSKEHKGSVVIINTHNEEHFNMDVTVATPVKSITKRVADEWDIPLRKVRLFRKQLLRDGSLGTDNKLAASIVEARP